MFYVSGRTSNVELGTWNFDRYRDPMTRRAVFAAILTALGILITLYSLRDGIHLSFVLLLGLLLIADGILRFALLSQDHAERSESR
jgi:uncharacterized protein (DUF58 family)